MKTLLLSLAGIISASSSSILPVAMMNNHQNINQIETNEIKTQEKLFKTKLNTDYGNSPIAGHTHDCSNDFSKNFEEIRKFISESKIQEWKIVEISTYIDVDYIPARPPIPIGHPKNKILNDLNTALHAKTISGLLMKAELDGPFGEDEWSWWIKVGKITADGTEISLTNLDGFYKDFDRLPYAYEGGIKDGINFSIKIEYTEPEEMKDISTIGAWNEGIANFRYNDQTLETFKQDFALPRAVDALKKGGIEMKPEWLSFKSGTLLEDNKEITEELISGNLGAGHYQLKITFEVNELGNQNKFIGENYFLITLSFGYADLASVDQHAFINVPKLGISSYSDVLTKLESYVKNKLFTNENAFYFLKTDSEEAIKIVKLYNYNHTEFTKDDFDNTTAVKYPIMAVVSPTEYGKRMGILNSNMLFLTFKRG